MSKLQAEFRRLMAAGLDISEHLGLLKGLASNPKVTRVVEIGFREGVSATALAAAGKSVIAYDINPCARHVRKLSRLAPKFIFKQRDNLDAMVPVCDLLHIDGLHIYDQLLMELRYHSGSVTRWIACHDTETFGKESQDGSKPGLMAAIHSFLASEEGEPWKILLHLTNNNGMTVLERIPQQ